MEDVQTIELVSEQLDVTTNVIPGDTVKVSVQVSTEAREVAVVAASESISIETVEIGLEVAEAPLIRTEGNVTIIPILEEVTVVTKRLILRQEIRMTRTRTETTSVETVPLRTERAVVERFSSHKPTLES